MALDFFGLKELINNKDTELFRENAKSIINLKWHDRMLIYTIACRIDCSDILEILDNDEEILATLDTVERTDLAFKHAKILALTGQYQNLHYLIKKRRVWDVSSSCSFLIATESLKSFADEVKESHRALYETLNLELEMREGKIRLEISKNFLMNHFNKSREKSDFWLEKSTDILIGLLYESPLTPEGFLSLLNIFQHAASNSDSGDKFKKKIFMEVLAYDQAWVVKELLEQSFIKINSYDELFMHAVRFHAYESIQYLSDQYCSSISLLCLSEGVLYLTASELTLTLQLDELGFENTNDLRLLRESIKHLKQIELQVGLANGIQDLPYKFEALLEVQRYLDLSIAREAPMHTVSTALEMIIKRKDSNEWLGKFYQKVVLALIEHPEREGFWEMLMYLEKHLILPKQRIIELVIASIEKQNERVSRYLLNQHFDGLSLDDYERLSDCVRPPSDRTNLDACKGALSSMLWQRKSIAESRVVFCFTQLISAIEIGDDHRVKNHFRALKEKLGSVEQLCDHWRDLFSRVEKCYNETIASYLLFEALDAGVSLEQLGIEHWDRECLNRLYERVNEMNLAQAMSEDLNEGLVVKLKIS